MYGYEYDARGRLTKITDAMGRIEQYTYDGRSNVATKKDPNGITLTYTYDALDRLEQVSTGVSAIDVTYQYYLTGRLKQEKNDTATLVYKYDSLGRMVSMTDGTFTQTYGYNLSGNTTSALLKQNATTITNIAYTYDKLGRMTAVYDTGVVSPTPTASYTYDANGNRASLTYANGITTTYAYNHANMVTQIKNMAGSTVRSQYDYQYNYDGNQKQKTAVESGVTTTTAYVYDGMGRLTKETQAITGGATTVWDYTYDLRHNRTSMTQGAVTTKYTYDNSNRLTQSSDGTDTTVYTYDANGNQTKVEVNGVTTESYTYNRLNQQTSATKGGVTTAYTYRPDGLRNSKKVGSGAVIKHVYDGWSIIAELNGSTVVNKVVRGIGAVYIDISGVKSYYLYNAHGDVTQLTNTGGAVTKVYKYDAFGVEINPDVNDANPYRYCAEYFDKETGSIYLRARYYQPKTGRFMRQDDWEYANPNDPLSLNLYTYCWNNPVMYIDPTGHYTQSEIEWYIKNNPNAVEKAINNATPSDSVGRMYEFKINGQTGLFDAWECSFGINGQVYGSKSNNSSSNNNTKSSIISTIADSVGHLLKGAAIAVLAPFMQLGGGAVIPWSSSAVSSAANQLNKGATSITVKTRAEAEELFLGLYQGNGYTNTTGMSATEAKQYSGGKTGTYHWDDGVGSDGRVEGHSTSNPHGSLPHLQIHKEDGTIVRIYYTK